MKITDMKKFHKFNKQHGGTFIPHESYNGGWWFMVREDRMNKLIDLIESSEAFFYEWADGTDPKTIMKVATAYEDALVELEKE